MPSFSHYHSMTISFKQSLKTVFVIIFILSGVIQGIAQIALPNMSVVCVRELPGHSKELGTQVLMGIPVKVISREGQWLKVKTVDGYDGYIIEHSLVILSDDDYDDWRQSDRVIYSDFSEGIIWADTDCSVPVSDIVPGCIVRLLSTGSDSGFSKVSLPDGRVGYIRASALTDLSEWASQRFDASLMLGYANAQMGRPYLWGGTSGKSMDCSGLTWVAAWLNGRVLPRNASAQAKVGERVSRSSDLQPGNLLFFGVISSRRVNHVAIYEADGLYIESSGRVRRSRLKAPQPGKREGYLHSVDISGYPPVIESDAAQIFFLK